MHTFFYNIQENFIDNHKNQINVEPNPATILHQNRIYWLEHKHLLTVGGKKVGIIHYNPPLRTSIPFIFTKFTVKKDNSNGFQHQLEILC